MTDLRNSREQGTGGPGESRRGETLLGLDDTRTAAGSTFGEGTQATVADGVEQITMRLVKNEIWARLPFAIDIQALSRDLVRLGYSLARADDDTRAQGWGADDDREDYMPYWVYHEDDGWYFAFPPEDYYSPVPTLTAADPGSSPRVGGAAEGELKRWLPVLRRNQT